MTAQPNSRTYPLVHGIPHRWNLISKLQDTVHYLQSVAGHTTLYESTFGSAKTLHELLANYESGKESFLEAHDFAFYAEAEGIECKHGMVDPLGAPHAKEFESVAEVRRAARKLLASALRWCEEIRVDPWCAKDLTDDSSH